MDASRHQRIKQLFVEASPLDPIRQRKYLDRACAGDRDLRAEVEALLESDRAASNPLDALPAAAEVLRWHLAAPGEPERPQAAPEPVPESIGGYRIIRK